MQFGLQNWKLKQSLYMSSLDLEQGSFRRSQTSDKLLKDTISMRVAKLFKHTDADKDTDTDLFQCTNL